MPKHSQLPLWPALLLLLLTGGCHVGRTARAAEPVSGSDARVSDVAASAGRDSVGTPKLAGSDVPPLSDSLDQRDTAAYASDTNPNRDGVVGPGLPNSAQYLAPLSVVLHSQWPSNRTVNLVFHGHSVPSGYFKTPLVDTFNAYPHLSHVALKQRYPYAVMNAITTSIGGENSEGGERRFAKDVLTMRPDVVFIDYALNDRAIGLARARAAWTAMITAAQAQGIPVILLTPTPDTTARLSDPNDPLSQHAQQIRELASEYGVGLVDSLAAFVGYVNQGGKLLDLMAQNNHPNRRGHDLVAAEIVKWFP